MSDLAGLSDLELRTRLEKVAETIEDLTKQVGPLLIRIGHLRNEGDLLIKELEARKQKDVEQVSD